VDVRDHSARATVQRVSVPEKDSRVIAARSEEVTAVRDGERIHAARVRLEDSSVCEAAFGAQSSVEQ
jgi:hypothetical protein